LLVIELLDALGADLDPELATLGAAAFDLGQLVEDRDARVISRRGSTNAEPNRRGVGPRLESQPDSIRRP
jgi:hypothetical protein